MPITYANPPKECDTCSTPIISEFSDAYIPAFGQWGNICPGCAITYGIRYGTGQGQKFQRQGKDFGKVEG